MAGFFLTPSSGKSLALKSLPPPIKIQFVLFKKGGARHRQWIRSNFSDFPRKLYLLAFYFDGIPVIVEWFRPCSEQSCTPSGSPASFWRLSRIGIPSFDWGALELKNKAALHIPHSDCIRILSCPILQSELVFLEKGWRFFDKKLRVWENNSCGISIYVWDKKLGRS